MDRARRLRLLAIAIPVIAPLVAADARAAGPEQTDLRSFRPSTDRRATLATEGVQTPGAWNLQFAQWLTFETASLRVREPNGESRRVLGPRLIADPAVALGLGRRAAIGATIPYVVYQDASASSLTNGLPASSTGIGDLAITGKAMAIEPDPNAGGLGLAFLSRVQVPTGERHSFISDKGAIVDARALVSYDYAHTLTLFATAGYRARFVHHAFPGVTIGDTIPWGTTISLRPQGIGLDDKGRWTWSLEAHGEIGAVPNALFSTSRVSPTFAGASARYDIDRNLSLFAGVEGGFGQAIGAPAFRAVFSIVYAPTVVDDDHDGVPDDVDECPGLPEDGQGAQPRDGCPDYEGEETEDYGPPPMAVPEPPPDPEPPPVASSDADADGIPDELDKCPDQPETKNGYEDEDGCPEIDTDGDTFLDPVDHCPDKAETWNGFEDDDGCPDEAPPPKKGTKPAPPIVTEQTPKGATAPAALLLARPIGFEGASPTKESTADLRAIAAWLLAHPGARVRVAVKPEGKGEDAAKLADARAAAIVDALVSFAHTGNVAEAATWDPKQAPAKGNVSIAVIPAPPPAPPAPSEPPPSEPPPPSP